MLQRTSARGAVHPCPANVPRPSHEVEVRLLNFSASLAEGCGGKTRISLINNMKPLWHVSAICAVLAAICSPGLYAQPALPNPILFVTQVPIPDERNDNEVSNVFVSVVSPLGNHLGDTTHAGRGGDLWMRYTNGALLNVTRAAGLGVSGVQHGNGIGVRDPFVHWNGKKAMFSMVTGAPVSASDTNVFYWQLYEITNLAALLTDSNTTPAIVKVPNQPTNYNNVMACYGSDGRIIFCTDRTRSGARHLYPQLDEYNNVPSNSGLWSLDPAT